MKLLDIVLMALFALGAIFGAIWVDLYLMPRLMQGVPTAVDIESVAVEVAHG